MTQDLQGNLQRWQDRVGTDGPCHAERAAYLAFCDRYRLPPTPDAVALYLIHLYDTRPRSAAALRYRLRLLDLAAALAGEPPPSRDASLKRFLRGLNRSLSDGLENNRTPLYLEDVDALLHAVDRDRRHQLRDTALVLLADATNLPLDALRLLQWHQVRLRRGALTLTVPQYKWARGARGTVTVTPRPGPACPVEAMRAWSRDVGPSNGFVFATRARRPPGALTAARLVEPLRGPRGACTWESPPAPLELLLPYLAHLGRTRPRELRDRAVILLAFAACLTTDEARQLRVGDVRETNSGLLVHPSGRQEQVGVPRGRVAARCPAAAWAAWHTTLRERGVTDADLAFPQVQERAISRTALDGYGPTWLVRARCAQAGLQGDYGFTSLRIGFLRTAARAGVPEQLIAQQAGLHCLDSVMLHVRRERLLTHNAAALVGL